MIDYNEEFRLFLSTRNPNPLIPPDASSIVMEVNFTTTGSGLRGQVGNENNMYVSIYIDNEHSSVPLASGRSHMVPVVLMVMEIFSST